MAVVAPLFVEVDKPDPLHGGLLNVGKSLGFLHDVANPHIGMGAEWEAAVCGNPDFVRSMRKQLYLAGASLARIHADAFLPPAVRSDS